MATAIYQKGSTTPNVFHKGTTHWEFNQYGLFEILDFIAFRANPDLHRELIAAGATLIQGDITGTPVEGVVAQIEGAPADK